MWGGRTLPLTQLIDPLRQECANFLHEQAVPSCLSTQLHRQLDGFWALAQTRIMPPIAVPWACYGMLASPFAGRGLQATGAMVLFYNYLHLLDDVEDGELEPDWDPALAINTANHLLFLAQAWLLRLELPIAPSIELGLELTKGQQRDLARDAKTPAEAILIARQKTGASLAMYATYGAIAAGAPPDLADAFKALGYAWGTLLQVYSDGLDVWDKPISPDLARQAPTVPILHGLSSSDEQRSHWLTTALAHAGQTPLAHLAARQTLTALGSLTHTVQVVERLRQEALEQLARVETQFDLNGQQIRQWLQGLRLTSVTAY